MSQQWRHHRWSGDDQVFMRNAQQQARDVIRAVEQREETLLRIGAVLVERQGAFLKSGVLALMPLTMKDVADELSLHESTISRAVQGKYAQTPIGVIELKQFFSAGLSMSDGSMISVQRVQQRVKTLIDNESADKPLSDQAIANRLAAEGIDVARRTVTKYREQLGLPKSSQRRQTRASV
jgi:RNA polymerase sigma-54 factor